VSLLRKILFPMVCLMLWGCTQYQNRYLEREDTVTSSAGDALASNAAVQIPTPWPRYSNDTTIAMDGERIARAVARYREGEKQPIATVPDTPVYGSTFGSANASSQESGAAAAPPPGQGYGAGAAATGAGAAPGP
jgi:type IV pilus biogenesis protein CpaD/CtpE